LAHPLHFGDQTRGEELEQMKMDLWLVGGLVLSLAGGCSKQARQSGEAGPASSTPRVPESALQSSGVDVTSTVVSKTDTLPSPAAPSPHAESTSAPAAIQAEPPTSFTGAKKETIDGAVGLGCEPRSSAGWLELICRKRNGTGGHPLRAELDTDPAELVQADEHGELRLVLPFQEGMSRSANIEWSDTKYVLHVRDGSAKLEWAGANLSLRRACAAFSDESRAVLTAAQKADGDARLLPSEVAKLPRFAGCVQAGRGSWALGLKSLVGSGAAAERKLTAELELAFVRDSGQRLSAPLGTFEFAPGGLELPALQAYDYDDDGNDEAILSYELRARPPSASLPDVSAIWSFSDSGVAPYPTAPKLAAGSSGTEHLEFDMRPDLGDYGPFIAWLAPGCGLKDCAARLTGPRFFWHSLTDGSFSNSDGAAKAALKRACPKKPASVMVGSENQLNAPQTAKALVCARAWGATTEQIETELASKVARLCGEAATCPLLETLQAWAKAELPVSVEP
jgi:hypothetical protein